MTHTVNDQRGRGASNYTYAQNYAMGVAQLAGIDRDGRLQLRTERWANLKRYSRIQQMKHTEHEVVPPDHTKALLVPAGARLSSQRDERFDFRTCLGSAAGHQDQKARRVQVRYTHHMLLH
jgi:hypothetical protein